MALFMGPPPVMGGVRYIGSTIVRFSKPPLQRSRCRGTTARADADNSRGRERRPGCHRCVEIEFSAPDCQRVFSRAGCTPADHGRSTCLPPAVDTRAASVALVQSAPARPVPIRRTAHSKQLGTAIDDRNEDPRHLGHDALLETSGLRPARSMTRAGYRTARALGT